MVITKLCEGIRCSSELCSRAIKRHQTYRRRACEYVGSRRVGSWNGQRSRKEIDHSSVRLESLFLSNSNQSAGRLDASGLSGGRAVDDTTTQTVKRFRAVQSTEQDDLKDRKHDTTHSNVKDREKLGASLRPIGTIIDNFKAACNGDNYSAANWQWRQARASIQGGARCSPKELDRLYAVLLSGFFAMRHAEIAIEVWNFIVQQGHSISIMHWTAMLQGCAKAYDAVSLQQLWARLNQTDIVLDNHAWTAYISGLIRCKKVQEGLEALDQLGQQWDLECGKDVGAEAHLTPSLEAVHVILNAFVDAGQDESADKLLHWTQMHGLEPTTQTYNIILHLRARTGDMSAIRRQILNMSRQHCEPDVVTFTIIISSMVVSHSSGFQTLSPQEQESLILDILSEMVAHGIRPNNVTYSTLLSSLLKSPRRSQNEGLSFRDPSSHGSEIGSNLAAAQAVMSHMRSQDLTPNATHYSILFNYLFSLPPTDATLTAIHHLWESILSPGSATRPDALIYDQMIQGLSGLSEFRFAQHLLVQMVHSGKSVSWNTLSKLLDDLAAAKEWEEAQWLVRQVEREDDKSLLRCGERSYKDKRRWDHTARQLTNGRVLGVGRYRARE